ncbi:hypothetical protein N9U41_01790 [Acidimicrobiaceae bacterium]|nr:hypothetical protein [Acidimicrobiaceae bacterium]
MKKILTTILPIFVLKLLITIKHFYKNYSIFSRFAILDRKIEKNIELGDDEYYQFKPFLDNIPEDKKTYIDIGAGNGVDGSCTLQLAKDPKWKGILFEYRLYNLPFFYRNFKNIGIGIIKITPYNIVSLIESFTVLKNPGFLSLDIDSYDYEVMKNILESGIHPYIVSIEINEKIPPPIEFYVKYNEKLEYPIGDFYGCSLQSTVELFSKHNYFLNHIYGNNAFFLNKSLFLENNNLSVMEKYKNGYVNLPNRKELFFYNKEWDSLFDLNIKDSKKFIVNYFRDFEGEYYIN